MRVAKVGLAFIFVIAVLFVIGFFSLGFILSPQDKPRKSDAIVAISGGETDARAREAAKLYQEKLAPVIIFSGAAFDPQSPSNAAAMRRIAIAEGVPADAIMIEESSKNTAENALDVKPIITSVGARQIILVTSPYHQRRAHIEFQRVLDKDTTILNHSAPDQSWRRSHWWASEYSFTLTMSELQKTLYVLGTKQVSFPNQVPTKP